MTKAELQGALNTLDHVAGPITTVVAVLRDVIAQTIHGDDLEPGAQAEPQAAEAAPAGADPFLTPEPFDAEAAAIEQTEVPEPAPEAPDGIEPEDEPSHGRRGRRS